MFTTNGTFRRSAGADPEAIPVTLLADDPTAATSLSITRMRKKWRLEASRHIG